MGGVPTNRRDDERQEKTPCDEGDEEAFDLPLDASEDGGGVLAVCVAGWG